MYDMNFEQMLDDIFVTLIMLFLFIISAIIYPFALVGTYLLFIIQSYIVGGEYEVMEFGCSTLRNDVSENVF